MQGTIIALRGMPKSGKTNTIVQVYYRLLQGGATPVPGGRPGTEVRRCVLEIDGVKVGINSSGDVQKDVEDDVDFLAGEECVVIVCATRRCGTWKRPAVTEEAVARVARKYGYSIVWIDKKWTPPPEQARNDANRDTADKIISEVERAIEAARGVEVEENKWDASNYHRRPSQREAASAAGRVGEP
jgi:hypothetical protein